MLGSLDRTKYLVGRTNEWVANPLGLRKTRAMNEWMNEWMNEYVHKKKYKGAWQRGRGSKKFRFAWHHLRMIPNSIVFPIWKPNSRGNNRPAPTTKIIRYSDLHVIQIFLEPNFAGPSEDLWIRTWAISLRQQCAQDLSFCWSLPIARPQEQVWRLH